MSITTQALPCIGCGEIGSETIVFLDAHLCSSCEARLVASHVDDPQYDHWVGAMKSIWKSLADRPVEKY